MASEDVEVKLRELAGDAQFPHQEAARRALRFRESGDVADLVAIADDPHGCATTDMLFAMAGQRKTWLNWVPMPEEAVSNMARDMARRQAAGETGTITELGLSGGEPASALAAFLRAAGAPVKVGIAEFGEPDMRVPLRPGKYAVWRYEGDDAVPAVAPPSAAAVETLYRVGAEPWPSPLSGYLQAEPLGELSLDDLLGLLVHPPQAPDIRRYQILAKSDPVYWYRLLQPWVCLGILHHRADEPWETSTRRQVLVDLAFGVEDWVSDAALFALVTAAYREPGLRDEVRVLVRDRLVAATEAPRPVMIWTSLAHLMLITPGAAEGEKELARAVLRQSEPDDEDEDEVAAEPAPVQRERRPGGWRRWFGRG
ncbi:hypothetical protein ACTOB_006266 [Actinoplanes oblitus]|uniref:Uncharacterized protein n=1 Tax=Actinoplanes oblitus TaxID=3040509 RepID=A0ABY8W9S7_9ACTN|nr:hypothetical protein [Actinoplanes oblitus]WIM94252.1 hypothetical protein ACTOB_006266 [Actinoplanes oblitus]